MNKKNFIKIVKEVINLEIKALSNLKYFKNNPEALDKYIDEKIRTDY